MKQIEDFIVMLLWGLVCSGTITGILLGDKFVFGVLGMTNKPQGFPEYTVLSASAILAFLLIIYHIVRNSHRKKTETDIIPDKNRPFEPAEFRTSDDSVFLYFFIFVFSAFSLFCLYMAIFTLDPLFGGKFALDTNNPDARRQCVAGAAFCMFLAGGVYWATKGRKYYITAEGFSPESHEAKSRYCPMIIPWNKVENVSIHAVQRSSDSLRCIIIFHGIPPLYFKEIGYSRKQFGYQFNHISRSELEKAKEAISRIVPLKYIEEQ